MPLDWLMRLQAQEVLLVDPIVGRALLQLERVRRGLRRVGLDRLTSGALSSLVQVRWLRWRRLQRGVVRQLRVQVGRRGRLAVVARLAITRAPVREPNLAG